MADTAKQVVSAAVDEMARNMRVTWDSVQNWAVTADALIEIVADMAARLIRFTSRRCSALRPCPAVALFRLTRRARHERRSLPPLGRSCHRRRTAQPGSVAQRAWRQHGRQWISLYGTRSAQNPGYVSVGVPVPRPVLMQAIVEAMLVS